MTSLKRKRRDSRIKQDEQSRTNKIQKKNIVIISICILFLSVFGKLFGEVINKVSGSNPNISKGAKLRKPKKRTTWAKENDRISDRMFYRLFRMHKPCFNALCSRIERAVGEKTFKSERYIENLQKLGNSTQESRMYHAHCKLTGNYIPGEVKLAITLRLLAGASYFDMFL